MWCHRQNLSITRKVFKPLLSPKNPKMPHFILKYSQYDMTAVTDDTK